MLLASWARETAGFGLKNGRIFDFFADRNRFLDTWADPGKRVFLFVYRLTVQTHKPSQPHHSLSNQGGLYLKTLRMCVFQPPPQIAAPEFSLNEVRFCIKSDEFRIKIDEFCNDEWNDDRRRWWPRRVCWCRWQTSRQRTRPTSACPRLTATTSRPSQTSRNRHCCDAWTRVWRTRCVLKCKWSRYYSPRKWRFWALKNDDFGATRTRRWGATPVTLVGKNDEFCIQNGEFCIQNGEVCIQNGKVCIQNDEFCRWLRSFCAVLQ